MIVSGNKMVFMMHIFIYFAAITSEVQAKLTNYIISEVVEYEIMFDQFPDSVQLKKPGHAVLISAGATIVLMPVAGMGIIVGPGAGSVYADDWKRAKTGIGIRSVSLILVAGIALSGSKTRNEKILMNSAGIVLFGSALFDIFYTSVKSVNEYNEKKLQSQKMITV
jgi:hypothetical protein